MKTIFTLLLIMLLTVTAKAQQLEYLTEDDLVLSIVQAELDGEDYSELYVKNEAFLAFYYRDSTAYFANVWQKSDTQSYGRITLLELGETNNGMTASVIWKYANSYDDKIGTAQIILRLTNRPVSVSFELSVLTESGSLSIYKGYVNGSLNWKPYF